MCVRLPIMTKYGNKSNAKRNMNRNNGMKITSTNNNKIIMVNNEQQRKKKKKILLKVNKFHVKFSFHSILAHIELLDKH